MTETAPLQQRNRELSILNSIAQALNQSVDLSEAVETTLAQVARLLDLQTGWVWLLQETTGAPYLAAAQNLPPALAENPASMEGNCYCLRTFRAGDLEGAANINVVECSRLEGLISGTAGLRYHASIPLYAHGKKLGVLNVTGPDWRRLTPEELQLLYTIGDMLGIAVERASLFDKSVELGAVQERNRLAREIHDTLAQGLTAVSLQLESADALLETDQDPRLARQSIQTALQMTRANLEEVRRSVLDLRAAPLEGRTLAQALTALVAETDLPATITITGGHRPLSPRLEIGLYRIAQEALTNVQQHAVADAVTVKLAVTAEQVQLEIQDNGRGFDRQQVEKGRFGLIGMAERVKLLGGQLHLESSPGTGTRIEVAIKAVNG